MPVTHSSHEPSVPANYFGRGENFDLSSLSPDELRQFEADFKAWEAANPHDPAGESALAEWKRGAKTRPKSVPSTHVVIVREKDLHKREFPKVAFDAAEQEKPTELELTLPKHAIEKLKNYAKFKARRPRDIIFKWIEELAHIA